MNEQDFCRLWQRTIDGDLEAREKVAAELFEDPSRLQAMVDEREVDAMLQTLGGRTPEPATLASFPTMILPPDMPLARPSAQDIEPVIKVSSTGPVSPRRFSTWWIGAGAMAIVAASALFAISVWFPDPPSAPQLSHNPSSDSGTRALSDSPALSETMPEGNPWKDAPALADEAEGRPASDSGSPAIDLWVNPREPEAELVSGDLDSRPERDSGWVPSNRGSEPGPPVPGMALPDGLELVRLDGTPWQPTADQEQTATRLRIPTGQGKLLGSDGLEIAFVGPMEARFGATGSIQLMEGNYLVDVPRESMRWDLETPLARLQPRRGSEFQLRVEGNQALEAWVDRGKLSLDRPDQVDGELPIELAERRMCQAVLTRPSDEALPTVLMARGPQLFLGQVLFEGQSAPTTRPEQLTRIVRSFENNRQSGQAPNVEAWSELVQEMQRTHRQANQPSIPLDSMLGKVFDAQASSETPLPGSNLLENSQSNSSFQGMINMNGQSQQFDSLEDFRRAGGRLPQLGDFPGMRGQLNPPNGVPGQPNVQRDQAFDAEVNLNGRRLRFTSPEQFEAIRRQLNLR